MAGFELTARDAVIGQSGTLTVVKPGNGYTFRFSYAFGGASGTLESGDVRQVSYAAGRAVYRWRVPEELVQQIPEDKGIADRKLFERFPEIRNQLWKGELWNHSYYVETIGSVSEENIRRYMEHQSKSY